MGPADFLHAVFLLLVSVTLHELGHVVVAALLFGGMPSVYFTSEAIQVVPAGWSPFVMAGGLLFTLPLLLLLWRRVGWPSRLVLAVVVVYSVYEAVRWL